MQSHDGPASGDTYHGSKENQPGIVLGGYAIDYGKHAYGNREHDFEPQFPHSLFKYH
jgi:hypothetical protein